jgi:exopolysaccharide biosynthesis polyprenyl glycosylphosphotransferase
MTTITHIDFDNSNMIFSAINDRHIRMPKRFSAAEAALFESKFSLSLEDLAYKQIITLDFKDTLFIDSSGIGALVKCKSYANNVDKSLQLINVNDQIKAVLKMTKLDHLFLDSNDIKQDQTIDNLPLTHQSIKSKLKRSIDIIGSLVGLLITAVLFPFIAIAIKLDSQGPVLFHQTRIGWMGKRFKLYKFRTMVKDAEARKTEVKNEAKGAIFKNANDPRITNSGKFLRKTSLDELPQFWNVLTGNMSLVGTRPPTSDELEQYKVLYWQRLDVKPGITGEWQVNGRSNVKNFEDIIKLDLKYQQNWSIWYDIKLMLKTLTVLFKKDNGAS